MSFFEDLGKKLSFAMGETVSKTKEIAGVTKLNTSISARQHEIEDAYREIGRKLYERECNDPDSPVAALCAKVAANLESIQDMKNQIANLKNETVENRKARSEAIFGAEAETKEEPSEQNAETVTEEAAQEAAEVVAERVEPVVEAAAETTEAVAEAAEAAEKAVEAAAEAEAAEPTDNAQ